MWERTTKAIPFAAVLDAALGEAGQRGARKLGTDHLLLGLLHDADSVAARALGVTLEDARAALDDLDRAALATIGLDVSGLELPAPQGKRLSLSRNNVTSSSRAVLHSAVEATGRKTRHLAPSHLLRSILALREPDPAAELLGRLGVDTEVSKHRLAALEA
ncbi:Clp protease N-terminal domain-containing protein [Nocardia sp. NPDC051756]|uniref:Clp protease N-terminal domain-containing protein n=1 Tax=Nocardia sp. NPDC051756 TaxID=3154751 RepID=UPI0034134FCD